MSDVIKEVDKNFPCVWCEKDLILVVKPTMQPQDKLVRCPSCEQLMVFTVPSLDIKRVPTETDSWVRQCPSCGKLSNGPITDEEFADHTDFCDGNP